VLALILGSVPAIVFLWNSPLAFSLKAATYILYMELILVWIQGVYLSALKDYRKIIKSYAVGTVVAVIFAYIHLKTNLIDISLGLLLALDVGIFLIVAMLMVNNFLKNQGRTIFCFFTILISVACCL
jgi:uncharacterized membrane protein